MKSQKISAQTLLSAMARGACCGLGSLLLAVAPLACYLHIEAPELVVDGESWLRDRASHSARRSCDAVVVLHRKADPVGTESWEIATLIAGSFFGEINAKAEMHAGRVRNECDGKFMRANLSGPSVGRHFVAGVLGPAADAWIITGEEWGDADVRYFARPEAR